MNRPWVALGCNRDLKRMHNPIGPYIHPVHKDSTRPVGASHPSIPIDKDLTLHQLLHRHRHTRSDNDFQGNPPIMRRDLGYYKVLLRRPQVLNVHLVTAAQALATMLCLLSAVPSRMKCHKLTLPIPAQVSMLTLWKTLSYFVM